MANIVQQIREKLDEKVRTATGLLVTDRLRFIFDVEKNDSRTVDDGFGVRYLGGFSASTVNKFYTIDQSFEIILTKRIPRQQDDDDALGSFNTLFDRADLIFKEILDTQIDLSFVLLVSEPSMDEPEILQDGSYAVLRLQVTVKYRQSLL